MLLCGLEIHGDGAVTLVCVAENVCMPSSDSRFKLSKVEKNVHNFYKVCQRFVKRFQKVNFCNLCETSLLELLLNFAEFVSFN